MTAIQCEGIKTPAKGLSVLEQVGKRTRCVRTAVEGEALCARHLAARKRSDEIALRRMGLK